MTVGRWLLAAGRWLSVAVVVDVVRGAGWWVCVLVDWWVCWLVGLLLVDWLRPLFACAVWLRGRWVVRLVGVLAR